MRHSASTRGTFALDNKSLQLTLDLLAQGNIHESHLDGLRSGSGEPLLHSVAKLR